MLKQGSNVNPAGAGTPTPTTNTLDFEPYVDAAVAAQFLQLARRRA